MICAILLAQSLAGRGFEPPPEVTALGGIRAHLRRERDDFQPSNITWAHLPPMLELKKKVRYDAMAQRALSAMDGWLAKNHWRSWCLL